MGVGQGRMVEERSRGKQGPNNLMPKVPKRHLNSHEVTQRNVDTPKHTHKNAPQAPRPPHTCTAIACRTVAAPAALASCPAGSAGGRSPRSTRVTASVAAAVASRL